jgi:predicted permease
MRITVVGVVLIAMAIIGVIFLVHYLGDRANRRPRQTGN